MCVRAGGFRRTVHDPVVPEQQVAGLGQPLPRLCGNASGAAILSLLDSKPSSKLKTATKKRATEQNRIDRAAQACVMIRWLPNLNMCAPRVPRTAGVATRAVPVEDLGAPGAMGVAVLRRVERAAVDLRGRRGKGRGRGTGRQRVHSQEQPRCHASVGAGLAADQPSRVLVEETLQRAVATGPCPSPESTERAA